MRDPVVIPAVWMPIRVGQHISLINFRWVQAIHPLPEGRTRLQFARRSLDCDEAYYDLTTCLALRLEDG